MLFLVRLPIDPGGRFAIAAILRYLILVIGFVLAFGMIGIHWSQIQWLAAAITVGLGFGLQEIFANFVSGLIILFERPIRIGDTVTVGEVSGTVGRIQIRATTIVGWDRKELVIPNKEFVTGKVINWTLSDSVLRISIPVGIAYGSDTTLADTLLRKVAEEHPFVLRDPAPTVLFKEFGESSLNFELFVFVGQLKHIMPIRNDLHRAIDTEFRNAGIEIAFPQRDIHIRSIKKALPIIDQCQAPPTM
ncbi:MAG: mechanosensitive ion channel [Phycisphaerales bacterium]|nr:mechanosensitive ion channel [Phycisphaerales bacterium]